MQAGTAGVASFAGGSTDSRAFTCPDSASVSVTGDMTVRIVMTRPTAAAIADCFNKFGSAGQRSWRLYWNTNGTLVFGHTSDGTTEKQAVSTAAVSEAIGSLVDITVELDVDNGASGHNVKFYTAATDGGTPVQLGSTVTTAGTSSVFDSTTALSTCNRGGTNAGDATYYRAELYNGIGSARRLVAVWSAGEMYSTVVTGGSLTGLDVCGNLWSGNSGAITQGVTGAPVLAVLNASVGGQALAYFTDSTRYTRMTGSRVRLCLINLSHNESAGTYPSGDAYRTGMAAHVAALATTYPDCAIVLVGQNPKKSPETADSIRIHRDRVRQLAEYAAATGRGFVDVFTALNADTASYIGADGVHPTAAGQSLWAQLVDDFVLYA